MKLKLLLIIFIFLFLFPYYSFGAQNNDIAINEISWMGTKASSQDEWIELYNNTSSEIDLSGWKITIPDKSLSISLSGKIQPQGYFLIERTDDNTVSIIADLISVFGSGLGNSGEKLQLFDSSLSLIDEVNFQSDWPAGIASPDYKTMERIDSKKSGNDSSNWATNNGVIFDGTDSKGNSIFGTPRNKNSVSSSIPISAENNQNQQSSELDQSNSIAITTPSSSNKIKINNPPSAISSAKEIFAVLNQEITLDGSGSFDKDANPLSFIWNFGDGSTDDKSKIAHRYEFPGLYIATLNVSDGALEDKTNVLIHIYPENIIINEFMPNPNNKDNNEWIEIFNSSDYIADLSEWKLNNFIFPKNSLLAGKNYLIIQKKNSKIGLKNSAGEVSLFYPNSEIADSIKYEKAPEGFSASRHQDKFIWTKNLTPGIQNVFFNDQLNKTEINQKTTYKRLETIKVSFQNEKTLSLIEKNKRQVSILNNSKIFSFIKKVSAKTINEFDQEPSQSIENTKIINPLSQDDKNINKENQEITIANLDNRLSANLLGQNTTILSVISNLILIGFILFRFVKR